MKFQDDSDRTAIRVFIFLLVLATIAWRVSKVYEDCEDGCQAAGQKFVKLEIMSIASGVCVCANR